MFNITGTLTATAFNNCFNACSSLTAASITNILASLVVNGQNNITIDFRDSLPKSVGTKLVTMPMMF